MLTRAHEHVTSCTMRDRPREHAFRRTGHMPAPAIERFSKVTHIVAGVGMAPGITPKNEPEFAAVELLTLPQILQPRRGQFIDQL